MAKSIKIILLLLIFATVLALQHYRSKAQQLEVNVAPVTLGQLDDSILASGNLVYNTQIQIRSELTGRVLAVLVEEGQQVAKDQLLLTLDPTAYQAEVTKAEAMVARARIDIHSHQAKLANLQRQWLRQQLDSVFNSITAVAAGVVGISLLVGGIGVMNIMLVSVTERTREIGFVKALGATPQFILLQFLVEALVLSLFGGLLGLLLGYVLATCVALMLPSMSDAFVPLWAIGLSIGFTSLIGLVFGIAPAVKAARLVPIEALRYE